MSEASDEPVIQRRISNNKIKFTKDIDLNALFNLNYNFDLLKGIIEELLSNQQILQDQMDHLNHINNDKDNRIKELEKEIQMLKEKQIDKALIDKLVQDLNDIKAHLKKHDGQIDDLYNKIKQLSDKIDAIGARPVAVQTSGDNSGIIEMIKQLEKETKEKFVSIDKENSEIRSEIEKLKKMIDELTAWSKGTETKVNNNTEKIEILFGKLRDVEAHFKEGDNELQKQIDDLKRYIEQKLSELSAQLELLLSNPKAAGGKISEGDLKILKELLQRINQLENEFREYMRKTNYELLWAEIEKLKKDVQAKADLSALEEIKKDLEGFQKQIEDILQRLGLLLDQCNEDHKDLADLKEKVKELFALMAELKSMYENIKIPQVVSGPVDIDLSKYLTVNQFDVYKTEAQTKFDNLQSEIDKLKKLIDELFALLKTKAGFDDLKKLEEFLLNKIDELAIACNKKFADKNETAKNLKYLESQIKHILALLKQQGNEHNADNWLLAKKPLNGFSCASCEAYIGELKENTQYVPWNKYPLRDPNEKLYRIGSGFSRMLQQLNIEGSPNHYTTESTITKKQNRTTTAFYRPKDSNGFNKNLPKIKKKDYNNSVEEGKVNNEQTNKTFEEEDENGPKITKIIRKTKN